MGGISHVMAKGWSYLQRGAKVYGPAVFGTGQEVMGAAYKKALTTKNPLKGQFYKDIWSGTKAAGIAAEKHAAKEAAIHGNFWKSSLNSIKRIPTKIKAGWKAGGIKATKTGKNVFLGKFKGAFKGIGKSMPILGSLMIAAFELPNIIKATFNEGLVQGLAETGKTGARLGGASLLGALGTAIGGPIGGIVGFIAGDWLTSKIVGKSYSERKAEEQEQLTQIANQTQTPSYPFSPQTNPFENIEQFPAAGYQQMLYGGTMNDDFMYNAYNKAQNPTTEQQKLNIQG